MSNCNDVILTFTTLPNAESADRIADLLVAEHLAACVSSIPGITSTYRWEGKFCKESEHLLLIKSSPERMEALRSRLLEVHPYETPEILHIPSEAGSARYLEWVVKECGE